MPKKYSACLYVLWITLNLRARLNSKWSTIENVFKKIIWRISYACFGLKINIDPL